MTTSAASSSATTSLFANTDLFLRFAKIEDPVKSEALLTKSMKLLAAKITTLNSQIQSLLVRDGEKVNETLESAVLIDLKNLQKLMLDVQTKAIEKKVDLKAIAAHFKSTADAHILFFQTQMFQKRLDSRETKNAAENFAEMKKGKYVQDMLHCLLINDHAEKDEIEKAMEFFDKIKGSKNAMNSNHSQLRYIYNSSLTMLLKAWKNSGNTHGQKQKMYELIMSKMSPERIESLRSQYPINMENVQHLRDQKHTQPLQADIENGDFANVKKAMAQIKNDEEKLEIARAVLTKYSEIYMLSEDEREKTMLKEELTAIMDLGKFQEEEKEGYLAIFED